MKDLNSIEQEIEKLFPYGMHDKAFVNLAYFSGFERFGTYETWGKGWVITGKGILKTDLLITSEHSSLERAWSEWKFLYENALALEASGITPTYLNIRKA
jgi:hypothetical protein